MSNTKTEITPEQRHELLQAGLKNIAEMCDRITPGNIAHHRLAIRAIAMQLAEVINEK